MGGALGLDLDDDEKKISSHQDDKLQCELRARDKKAMDMVLTAAKLVAPNIDKKEWVAGFDWVISMLKSEYPTIASEMEILKGIAYLRRKQFDKAVDTLKAFE